MRGAGDEYQAERDRLAALEPQPNASARLKTGPDSEVTPVAHAPVAAPAPGSLAREVQDGLRRLGCL